MAEYIIEMRHKPGAAAPFNDWQPYHPPQTPGGFYSLIEQLIMEQLPAGSTVTVERGTNSHTTQYRKRK